MQQQAERVVIGMDPHKRSATIEVMSGDETVLEAVVSTPREAGFAAMVGYVNAIAPDPGRRVWAVEGCNGIGHHIAVRLLAGSEQVLDVPPKLSARARVFATGQGRKTDATDAHSVALVGTRMAGLRPVVDDEQLAVLRVLVDRRRSLGEDHTRIVSQVHALLLELIPGGAKRNLSAAQAKKLLATVRPRDAAGKTRRRVAAELIGDLERIHARKKAADKELRELLTRPAPRCWTCTASAPPVPPGCWSRSATSPGSPTATTSRPGTAPHPSTPLPVTTSGTGCRGPGTARSTAPCTSWPPSSCATPASAATTTTAASGEGKSSMEAMRCLKRRLSDIVYRELLDDAVARRLTTNGTGPGGHRGNDSDSSAAGSQPHTGSSDKPHPNPSRTKPRTLLPAAS